MGEGILRLEPAARMKINFVIVAVIYFAVVALASPPTRCKYWCKSDHEKNAYYCCPSGKPDKWNAETMWPMVSWPMFWLNMIGTIVMHTHGHPHMEEMTKKKQCPPLRSVCSRSFDWYDPPTLCDKDDQCHPAEKCCFDVCLEHKTCKPAE